MSAKPLTDADLEGIRERAFGVSPEISPATLKADRDALLAEVDAMRAAFWPITSIYCRSVEMTDSPIWLVLGEDNNLVKAPFFSRREAEEWMSSEKRNLPEGAHVWCASGGGSTEWAGMLRFGWERLPSPARKGGPPTGTGFGVVGSCPEPETPK